MEEGIGAIKVGWKDSFATFLEEYSFSMWAFASQYFPPLLLLFLSLPFSLSLHRVKNLAPRDLSLLGLGLKRSFDLLNQFRIHTSVDNYGMGRNPWFCDPAAIILLTDNGKLTSYNEVKSEVRCVRASFWRTYRFFAVYFIGVNRLLRLSLVLFITPPLRSSSPCHPPSLVPNSQTNHSVGLASFLCLLSQLSPSSSNLFSFLSVFSLFLFLLSSFSSPLSLLSPPFTHRTSVSSQSSSASLGRTVHKAANSLNGSPPLPLPSHFL